MIRLLGGLTLGSIKVRDRNGVARNQHCLAVAETVRPPTGGFADRLPVKANSALSTVTAVTQASSLIRIKEDRMRAESEFPLFENRCFEGKLPWCVYKNAGL